MYQDKNGWIPLFECLPENGQECFVWYENNTTAKKSWCFAKYFKDDGFDVTDVTHWRPAEFKPPINRNENVQR